MKKIVLYIGSMQYGGANRVMANLANHFSEIGHDVVLVNDIFPRSDIPEYEVNSDIKRLYLENSYKDSVNKNIKMILDLRNIIKSENPDSVVSFMRPPNFRMLLSTIGLTCKKIVSVRNDPYMEYGYGLKRFISKEIFKLADLCIFQTEDAAKYFLKLTQEKSRIIYNPVRNSFYEVIRGKRIGNIVSVGRFEKQKNHRMIIDAFRKIADKYPSENLILYGEGSLKHDIQEYVDELKLKDRVFFPGTTSEVEKILSEAHIFVLSSDYEGMPNALMEAMAVGVPVISTDCPCGGPRTLIQNYTQGILVECGNSDQLANGMDMLLGNDNLCEEFSRKVRERALDFLPEKVYKQWDEII